MAAARAAPCALALCAAKLLPAQPAAPARAEPCPMPAAHAAPMVPITRAYLRDFYRRYPSPALSAGVRAARGRVDDARDALLRDAAEHAAGVVTVVLERAVPVRIDEAMFANRCACEEVAAVLGGRIPALEGVAPVMLAAGSLFEAFQRQQQERVSGIVNAFLPKDFRARLFAAARARSEARNAAAIEELVKAGGSIRERYTLMWDQQWARRESLAMVGQATGIWKLMVRYLAGIPAPLLQFAKEINSPNGPTDELRVKFGDVLTALTEFSAALHALALAIDHATTPVDEDTIALFEKSAHLYKEEVKVFVNLLSTVVADSPFFVMPEETSTTAEIGER